MKKGFNYSFVLMLLTVIVTSCSKQLAKPEGLTGTWEWKRTDGGLGNHLHQTPTNTGKTEQLKLTDSRQYIRYTNGVITEEGTYGLIEQTCIHDKKVKTVIQFSGIDQTFMIETNDRQQLVLSDENFDGVEIHYERKNLGDN